MLIAIIWVAQTFLFLSVPAQAGMPVPPIF
jgi:hypothetical protein